MQKKLVFVPVGGLANRMRAIASAVTLMEGIGGETEIVWFKEWAMNAPWRELFVPFDRRGVRLRDASAADTWLLDRPRHKNLGLPRLWQALRFDGRLYEQQFAPLLASGFDFSAWAQTHSRLYMASYSEFAGFDPTLPARLFTPVTAIREAVDRRMGTLTGRTIGVHIRRTDHAEAIRRSPIELFYAALDREIEADERTAIYLATDSEAVKHDLRARYGTRLHTAGAPADRESTAGIRDGLTDMYSLARCTHIYGSFGSTFSEMAARLGGAGFEVLALKD